MAAYSAKIHWYDRVPAEHKTVTTPLISALSQIFSMQKNYDFLEFIPLEIELSDAGNIGISGRFGGAKYSHLTLLIIEHMEKLKLTPIDLKVLFYLMTTSKTRLVFIVTKGYLAERLNIPYSRTCSILRKLCALEIIRWTKYKQQDGVIVSPDLVNTGTAKRRAFKRMLWEKKIVQPEKIEAPRYYPLTRKKRKTE